MPKKHTPLLYGYGFALGTTALCSGNLIVARGLSDIVPPVSLVLILTGIILANQTS